MSLLFGSFAIGVVLAQWQPCLPSPWVVRLCLPLGAGLLALALAQGLRRARYLGAALLAATALGYGWSSWAAADRLADRLGPAALAGAVVIDAWVADLPQLVHDGQRLLLAPVGTRSGLPDRILVTVPDRVLARFVPHGGDCVHATLKLQPEHGLLNFAGFDGEAWTFASGIRAGGRATALAPCGSAEAPWQATLQGVRDRIREVLLHVLGDRPAAGIVVALAVGDQGGVSAAQWDVLWRSGIGHLVSISGVHVTLLASLVRGLGERLWRRLPRACQRCPAPRAGAILGCLVALGYALVAGFAVPTRRTLFTLTAATLASWAGIVPGTGRLFWGAAATTLALDPFAALSPSFWLSFGAVGGLILADLGRHGVRPGWQAELGAQWVSNLALLPLLALWFGQISLVSPLANAIAIPLVGLVVTPLCLAAMFPGLHILALPADWLLQLLLEGLHWLTAPTWTALAIAAPGPWPLACGLCAVLVILAAPARIPGAAWALLALLPLLAPPEVVGEDTARVEVIDIGQGLSVLVRTRQHLLLFDTGPRWPGGDAGGRTLLPLFKAEGLGRLDALILSHPDADHVGGADSLLAERPASIVLSGFPRAAARPCAAGQSWDWDGVHFRMLYPPPGSAQSVGADVATESDRPRSRPRPRAHDRNNHACVLRVSVGDHAVLLPADIEAPAEQALLADPALRDALRSDVVVVAHHGSKTSSTAPFIAATGARYALISAGWHNHYHHPDPQVVARWRDAGAEVRETDRDGALSVELSGAEVRVADARDARPGYWRE